MGALGFEPRTRGARTRSSDRPQRGALTATPPRLVLPVGVEPTSPEGPQGLSLLRFPSFARGASEWCETDSNRRRAALQTAALPTELPHHATRTGCREPSGGFEPPTTWFEARHSDPLSYEGEAVSGEFGRSPNSVRERSDRQERPESNRNLLRAKQACSPLSPFPRGPIQYRIRAATRIRTPTFGFGDRRAAVDTITTSLTKTVAARGGLEPPLTVGNNHPLCR